MIRYVVFAAVAFSAASGTAQAQDRPVGRLTHLAAGRLLALCQSPRTAAVCDAYVSGISDGITLVESGAAPGSAKRVCIPQASGTQLRSTLVAWMSKHPDRMAGDVGPVAYDALAEAFPCGGAGAGPKP